MALSPFLRTGRASGFREHELKSEAPGVAQRDARPSHSGYDFWTIVKRGIAVTVAAMGTWKPKRIVFSTEDEVFAPFMEFCAAAYPDQSPVAAVREACLAYLGTDPLEAARVAARRAAFLEARMQINTIAARLMRLAMQISLRRVNEAEQEIAAMIAAGQIERGHAA